MKHIRILSILLFIIAMATVGTQAQKRLIRIGNQAFDAGEYHDAAQKLKKAYGRANDRSIKGELAFKMGVSYMRMNQPNYARNWLRTATVYRYSNPKVHLYYAQTLMKLRQYDKAKKQFEEYGKLVPDDPRADIGAKSADKIKQWKESPSRYQVNQEKDLNARGYCDFAPAFAGGPDLLYFTSSREAAKGDDLNRVSGNPYTDIFYSMMDRKGDWSEPVPAKGNINTEYDEGAPCLVDDGFVMYYTSCKRIKNKDMGCKIFRSELKGQEWGKPGNIELFGDSSISVGHPAVTEDELTMYFASDYPGGKGGKDIWIATRETPEEPWGNPSNAGDSINTPGDELYPYIHPDGALYFSSNGRIGMGGLDIYKAQQNEDGEWIVENMRPPINSSADDFGITFEMAREKGLFSSTRNQRGGIDQIYSFSLPPMEFKLVGTVVERETEKPLQANVELFGSDGTIKEQKTEKDGKFRFELDKETDYRVVTTKEDYLKGTGKETTRGLNKSKTIRLTITMASIDKPIELPNILYDLNSAELRPESMVALDELVTTLNDNPKITIELSSHTDFRDSEAYNQDLSQRRAQSVVDYLIENGIDKERLTPKGYGESQPKTVTEQLAAKYDFLPEGQVLDEAFIKDLPNQEQKEVAHQINRRTEFRVLSTDY